MTAPALSALSSRLRAFDARTLLTASVLGLFCALSACQDRTWEQYMEAAAFAFQDANYDEAEEWFLAAERVATGSNQKDPRMALTLGNLAGFYHAQARDKEAEPLYWESLALLEQIDGPEAPRVARFVADLAGFYTALDRYEEAEPLFLRAVGTLEWELGPTHQDVLMVRTGLAGLYLQQMHYGEAEAIYRDVLTTLIDTPDADRDQLVTVLQEYAIVLRQTDRDTDALALEARARALRDSP
jgi:tetratricopeptide (TPR) repeat protein